jgi:hypothetical protein
MAKQKQEPSDLAYTIAGAIERDYEDAPSTMQYTSHLIDGVQVEVEELHTTIGEEQVTLFILPGTQVEEDPDDNETKD